MTAQADYIVHSDMLVARLSKLPTSMFDIDPDQRVHPATMRSVMVAIFGHFNLDKEDAHPGRELIASIAGRSVATVDRALRYLTRGGYLVIGRRDPKKVRGIQKHNLYTLGEKLRDMFIFQKSDKAQDALDRQRQAQERQQDDYQRLKQTARQAVKDAIEQPSQAAQDALDTDPAPSQALTPEQRAKRHAEQKRYAELVMELRQCGKLKLHHQIDYDMLHKKYGGS